jgi:hypothetical protein
VITPATGAEALLYVLRDGLEGANALAPVNTLKRIFVQSIPFDGSEWGPSTINVSVANGQEQSLEPWARELVGDAANVVLGWVLGVASTFGVEKWNERKRLNGVKVAIAREFGEIAHRLVVLVHLLSERTGGFNRELLEWVLMRVRDYEGPNPKHGIVSGVEGLLKQSDDTLAKMAEVLKKRAEPQFVPAEDAPYASEAIADLRDFDAGYSTAVLDVLAHLRLLNEARENGMYYLRLTFTPNLGAENHKRAVRNVEAAYGQMIKRARIIVDKIAVLRSSAPT